jgi:hypothetical protein
MKTIRTSLRILTITLFLFSTSSCLIIKSDNGKHKGWFKNSNNPHNPRTTNPGKAKSGTPAKAKSKGKSR